MYMSNGNGEGFEDMRAKEDLRRCSRLQHRRGAKEKEEWGGVGMWADLADDFV